LVNQIPYVKIYWGSINNMIDLKTIITERKFMYLRVGIVELNIINLFKKNKQNLLNIYNDYSYVMTNHTNQQIYNFLDDKNTNIDIKILLKTTTNAGFYITEQAKEFDELEYCLNKYIDGYNNCDGFLRCDGCLLHMTELNLEIKPNYTIYIEKDIYNIMKNKNVLIISPFSEQINFQIETGNYKNLFLNDDMNNMLSDIYENCTLNTLNIPITIYGNPVHKSWKQTFEITCNKIKDFVKNTHVDLIIPSCGFYGIPLCNYIYSDLNISCLYYGNAIHQLFGLMQNDFYAFSTSDINIEKWINIDKHIICSINNNNNLLMDNLKKIDRINGRYILEK